MIEVNSAGHREIISVAVSTLIEDNIRDGAEDQADLDRLGDSLAKCQDYPLIIRSNLMILDGHRRVRAAKRKGITQLDAIIVEGDLAREQAVEIALRTAVHRKGLSDWEKFKTVKEIGMAHPNWTRKQLAEHIDFDPPEVTKLLTEGGPDVEEAFRKGQIRLGTRYELAKLPVDQQPTMLAAKLAGGTRDELVATARRRRNGSAPAVRLSRIRCELPEGTSVVVTGAEMSLDDLIAALGQALDAARKASKDGLDVKSLQAVLKAKAKKEGGK